MRNLAQAMAMTCKFARNTIWRGITRPWVRNIMKA